MSSGDDDAPFVAGSDTSEAAAAEIQPETSHLRRKVLAFLALMGAHGATDEEMQRGIPMAPNTQRPRRRELQGKGAIADSGRKRLTTARRQAVVWVERKG